MDFLQENPTSLERSASIDESGMKIDQRVLSAVRGAVGLEIEKFCNFTALGGDELLERLL